ncbi:MAG: hypothetical protein ABFC96_01105 [Thermoguttaceae bacterium]
MIFVACLVGSWGVAAAATPSSAVRPSETLLPTTTDFWCSTSDADSLVEHWDRSVLGRLMADPAMAPFARQLAYQLQEQWSDVAELLAMNVGDVRRVAGGEVAIARTPLANGRSAFCLTIDVTGKLPETRRLLEKIDARQLDRGARRSELEVLGTPVLRYQLPAARPKRNGRLERNAGVLRATEEDTSERVAIYGMKGNLFIAANRLELASEVLLRATGRLPETESLAGETPFVAVFQRCRAERGGPVANQLRWFAHPRSLASERREKRQDGDQMSEETVAARGVGGVIDFSVHGREIIYQVAIHVPRPIKAAFVKAALPEHPEFTAQPWVPDTVATYTTMYLHLAKDFDHLGPLFDQLFGEGEPASWEEMLQSIKQDPNGPRVDLRKDLVRLLGPRVTVLTAVRKPAGGSSDRALVAIEAKDEQAVASAIRRFLANDPGILHGREKGIEFWEVVKRRPPRRVAGFGDPPPLTRFEPSEASKRGDASGGGGAVFPHTMVAVWNGNLLIASHPDFLFEIVAPERRARPLSEDPDYRLVAGAAKESELKDQFLQFFSQNYEVYRPTYESVRQNKIPQGEHMIDRALRLLLGQKKRLAAPAIDGSQLPDYRAAQPYFGPGGLRVSREPEGWFAMGFALRRGPALERLSERPPDRPTTR